MVGYMTPDEQADADFSRIRRRAFLRQVSARVRADPASARLRCFDQLRKEFGAVGRVNIGLRTVRVDGIVGSVDRCSDFDRDFSPTRAGAKERWKRIDRAFLRGEELPPVSLYKLGRSYFVLDGHHRLSVARYQGVEWIDAQITEFLPRSPHVRADGS